MTNPTEIADVQTRRFILQVLSGEMQVAMKDLKRGDKFRIETDMIGDHLHGKEKDVWCAISDADKLETGDRVWRIDAVPHYAAPAGLAKKRTIVSETKITSVEMVDPKNLVDPACVMTPNKAKGWVTAEQAKIKADVLVVDKLVDQTELAIGDTVRLRSGGPPMMAVVDLTLHTTPERDPSRDQVTTAWIRDNGKPSRAVFPAACLLVDRKAKRADVAVRESSVKTRK